MWLPVPLYIHVACAVILSACAVVVVGAVVVVCAVSAVMFLWGCFKQLSGGAVSCCSALPGDVVASAVVLGTDYCACARLTISALVWVGGKFVPLGDLSTLMLLGSAI